MFDFLEQLRSKPVEYRKRVAIFTTVSLTAVIVFIWLSTFSGFDAMSAIDPKTVSEELKPFEEIKNSVGNFYDSVKEMSVGIFTPQATGSPSLEPILEPIQ